MFKTKIQGSTFLNNFKTFGDSREMVAKDFRMLEYFLCKSYKSKQKSLDSARFEKFNVIMRKENRNIGFFCFSTMSLSFLASLIKSCVAGVLKRSTVQNLEIPKSQNYGWIVDGRIHRVK